MLDRITRTRARPVLAGAFLVVLVATSGFGGPAPVAQAIGGPQLAGHGVVVNYPSRSVPRLPGIKASAFVVADASTGQVLAARDPSSRTGWTPRASTPRPTTWP